MSPIFCPIHEDAPGPSAIDLDALSTGKLVFRATGDPEERARGKLTLTVIREDLARIAGHRKDPNPHYLDGRDLYGQADFAQLPLPDQLHPDTAAHHRIGERFARLAFAANGPFASRTGADGQQRVAPAEPAVAEGAVTQAAHSVYAPAHPRCPWVRRRRPDRGVSTTSHRASVASDPRPRAALKGFPGSDRRAARSLESDGSVRLCG